MNTKTFATCGLVFGFALQGSAQLAALPPLSTVDGVPVRPIGPNAGALRWESAATLGAYRSALGANWAVPAPGAPDGVSGLTWAASAPASALAARDAIEDSGGTMRIIFVGGTTSTPNDLGYSYDGNPASRQSFTAFQSIQSGSNLRFGDFFDLNLAVGEGRTFDFWFNGNGSSGTGGTYTLFDPLRSAPGLATTNARWSQSPLLVSTWIPALGTYREEATYLVGFEEGPPGGNGDFSDLVVAIQFFPQTSGAFVPVPAPEPSTYGLIAAGALFGAAAFRRWRRARPVL